MEPSINLSANDDITEDNKNITKEMIDKILEKTEEIDTAMNIDSLRQIINAVKKKLEINENLRSKFPNDPEKYIDSEVDLHEEITVLQRIAAYPNLISDFVSHEGVEMLIHLLNHPNSDIVNKIANIVDEITDADFLNELDEPKSFLELFISNNIFEILVDNLFKANKLQNSEDIPQFTSDILSIIENFIDVYPLSGVLLGEKTKILNWLLSSIKYSSFEEVKLFSSEILDNILQSSNENRIKFAQMEGIPHLIAILASKKDEKINSGSQEEYISNLVNSICSGLLEKENQSIFLKSDGIRLMLSCLKEVSLFRYLSIKVLDFAIQNNPENCREFVESNGLGPLFSYFMAKGFKKDRAKYWNLIETGEEHCLGIMTSVVKYTSGVQLDRMLYKFKENKMEKCERLIELYQNSTKKILKAKDAEEKDEEAKFISEIHSGLFSLQQISILIGFILTQTKYHDITAKLSTLLSVHNISTQEIKETLSQMAAHLGEEFESPNDEYFSNKRFIIDIVKKLL